MPGALGPRARDPGPGPGALARGSLVPGAAGRAGSVGPAGRAGPAKISRPGLPGQTYEMDRAVRLPQGAYKGKKTWTKSCSTRDGLQRAPK